jgi:hypothetical protein
MIILGDTFMRNFYTTFNFRDEKLGLAVNASAPYQGIEIRTGPGIVFIIGMVAVFASSLILMCVIGFYCRKAKLNLK